MASEEELDTFLKSTLAETNRSVRGRYRKPKDTSAVNFDLVLSKKDTKIHQLINTNKDLKLEVKRLQIENEEARKEREESQILINELRGLAESFDRQLTAAKIRHSEIHTNMRAEEELGLLRVQYQAAKSEAEKYRKEANILTRALAVNTVEGGFDGETLLNRGQDQLVLDELRAEISRLKEIEDECISMQSSVKQANIRLAEFSKIENDLGEERIDNDRLRHQVVIVEGRLVSLNEENDKLRDEISRLEDRISEEVGGRMKDVGERDSKFKESGRKIIELESSLSSIQVSEKRLKAKVKELESILSDRDVRVETLNLEALSLRSSVTGMDSEIRSLAASLAAETEANDNLVCRLERVEAELTRAMAELGTTKRREKENASRVSELEEQLVKYNSIRSELISTQAAVKDRDSKIRQLEESKELYRRSTSGELDRLKRELATASSHSHDLSEKCRSIAREKEKIKNLLANDTMTRIGRIMNDTSRWD
jgi:chromosome segregation ATPase